MTLVVVYIILLAVWNSCIAQETGNKTEVLNTCGRPPGIGNGDIEGSQLKRYESGQSVTYRCMTYYVMSGSPTVTCLHGQWSEPPTCFEPCTVTEEDMKANKIILKWVDRSKIYVRHGESIEFQCQSNEFIPLPSHGFRIMCIRGHLNYPRCIGARSCNLSMLELVKNNLAVGKANTDVPHDAEIQLMCKSGFSPEPGINMTVRCDNQRLIYPRCVSNEIVCYFQSVLNGNLQPEKNVYRENEEITLVCNPGYQPEYKNNFPICTRTGWSTPLTCVLKDCDFPEIEDGSLYNTYYTTYKDRYFPMRKGKQIYYKCDANFFTETGNYWGSIECTDKGWLPTPKCIGTCEQFRMVNGYSMDSAARFRVGERVRYTCDHGYTTLEGLASGETQCLKSGWSVQPTCINE